MTELSAKIAQAMITPQMPTTIEGVSLPYPVLNAWLLIFDLFLKKIMNFLNALVPS